MRFDIPGTSQWVEYRGPEDLTIGDIDAYNGPIEELYARRADDDDGDDMVLSEDGVSMTPKPRKPIGVTVATLRDRRDALLERVITGWSFTAPLPYSPVSRNSLPAAALPALTGIYNSLTTAIDELDGPKEPTAPTDGSATTSPATSASAPPDSTPGPSVTAGGSSTTS